MIRVNIICEGQTEERFIKDLLYENFFALGIILHPIVLGSGNNYDKFKHFAVRLIKTDREAFVSSMIDLYGMNKRFPGYLTSTDLQPSSKVAEIENAIFQDISSAVTNPNMFIPYVQLHEFEALLFSNCEILERTLRLDSVFPKNSFSKIMENYNCPEEINDSRETAPSKRIEKITKKTYSKNVDGITIAKEIGLHTIRMKCPHFDAWIKKLESLAD